MARTRAVRFAPGAACGGGLAAEECADRMVVTTRRELSACGPALPWGTGGHPTLHAAASGQACGGTAVGA
jgi:hypothetical protein